MISAGNTVGENPLQWDMRKNPSSSEGDKRKKKISHTIRNKGVDRFILRWKINASSQLPALIFARITRKK